jgi:hypothetical protein
MSYRGRYRSAALLLLSISRAVGAHRAHVRSLPPPQPGFQWAPWTIQRCRLPSAGRELVWDLCRHATKPFIAPRCVPGAARGLIAILLTGSLAGCALYDIRRRESQRAEDEQACASSGYKPGTNQFAKCLQDRDLTRTLGVRDGSRAAFRTELAERRVDPR